MKLSILSLILIASFPSYAQSEQKADFFITGYEMMGTAEGTKQIYEVKDLKWDQGKIRTKHYNEVIKQKAAPVSSEENSNTLRKTLESFQKAITGLCISHLELSLAFNVSAKTWIVVSGEVEGTVKVILKNPNQKCPKS